MTQVVLGILIGLGILWHTASMVFPKYLRDDLQGPPVMVSEPKSIDFGVVRPGAELHGRVSVTNRGTRRLVLFEVSEECSCVANPLASFVVPAGESLSLPVRFRVRGPSQTPSGTPEQFVVRFASSDPAYAMLVVTLHAEVRSEHDQDEPAPVQVNVVAAQVADR